MCGCEVGADFTQVGATRLCRNCNGNAYNSKLTTEKVVKDAFNNIYCAGCKGTIDLPEPWTFYENKRFHDECLKNYLSVVKVVEKELKEINKDAINPDHYKAGGLETIHILEAKLSPQEFEGFLRGNVLKYVTRYSLKNGVEDLNKAKWYLEKLIEVKSK